MFSFLSRIFGRETPIHHGISVTSGTSKQPRVRIVTVVGESHYQDALEAVAGGRTYDGHNMPVTAALIPEDDNRHDPKAVRVEVSGQHVGYLSRANARRFRKRCNGARECPATIVGGWDRGKGDRGHFGVRIDFTELGV